ncbi:MAG: AraC family transcriptional regulator [Eubacteriales bacterium]|nr:AraC family transcriptional regulator [Eubacteriales bacterium]
MIIHLVEFNSIPRLNFASSTMTAGEYKNRVDKDGHLEISVHSGGRVLRKIYGKKIIIENNMMTVSMPDDSYEAKALDATVSKGVGVMMKIDEMNYKTMEINSKEEWNNIINKAADKVILPHHIELNEDYNSFVKIMMRIVYTSTIESVSANMKCIGMWFELISMIDSKMRNILEEENKFSSTAIYMKKSKKYIDQNYMKKVKISDLADELKITPNYLSKIFKDNANMTFTNYLNFTRVEKAREIFVYDKKISSEEVAAKVGFCDSRYMNIMFKKYLGLTVHKCRQVDNELSFCFVKPWEKMED